MWMLIEKKLFYHLRLVELEIVKTPTYPQHKVGFDHKMTLQTPHPTQTQYPEYLRCYWLDFDETLKTGSWEHL